MNLIKFCSFTKCFNRNLRNYISIMADRDRTEKFVKDIRGGDVEKENGKRWFVPPVLADNSTLYDIYTINERSAPKPIQRSPRWDGDHVKMPHDRHSKLNNEPRWQTITRALKTCTYGVHNSHDLEETIKTYNPFYKDIWRFETLHTMFEELSFEENKSFFNDILPRIARLALALPDLIQAPIPLLKRNGGLKDLIDINVETISLSKQQIACLIANAFFCTFPHRNTETRDGEYASYPNINFAKLYMSKGNDVIEKIKCLVHYLNTVSRSVPLGAMSFSRRSVPARLLPRWAESRAPLAPLRTTPHRAIQECRELIQLDFANKYLGGGVIGHGSVQEEIRFVISPELMVSKLFTEVMEDHEAVMMIGSEIYSQHIGYSRDFEFMGKFKDDTMSDDCWRRRNAVLAIDAKYFRVRNRDEYKVKNIDRELNKAWVGFSFFTEGSPPHFPGAATGNWGCGAFNGTPQLKALLQLMAAAQAARPLLYVTFGDQQFADDLYAIYEHLDAHRVTVGELYGLISSFARRRDADFSSLFAHLHDVVPRRTPQTQKNIFERSRRDKTETKQKQNSPDLFSQDELSQESDKPASGQKQMNVNKPSTSLKLTTDSKETKQKGNSDSIIETLQSSEDDVLVQAAVNYDTRKRFKMQSSSDEEAKREEKKPKTETHTSKLFNQMEKFDEDNGKLNLSTHHDNVLNKNLSDSDQEITPDVKKKFSRKITDYFSSATKKTL